MSNELIIEEIRVKSDFDQYGDNHFYSAIDFSKSLESSFIGSCFEPDERYAPHIVSNDSDKKDDVLSVIKREINDCVSFDFSVAFITDSGIQVLAQVFSELKKRGIPGRILTSTYQMFNTPDALRKLLEYPNIESRIFNGDLHSKGYFFDRREISTIIIGSSNLTQAALTCNKEWNVLFKSFPGGKILEESKKEFKKLWASPEATKLTSSWIDSYEEAFLELKSFRSSSLDAQRKAQKEISGISENKRAISKQNKDSDPFLGCSIKPNKMQSQALEALEVLHSRNASRALLISATGTGKTYLSALDVFLTKPKKVLFVAHRTRILRDSMNSFKNVLEDRYSYGMYGGSNKEKSSSCVFAMVGTLQSHLMDFKPDEFDCIIVDEAHRVGAAGYQKIIEYFTPKFLLGMTATPNRTDGYDVYQLFNHVIAYRITLQDALDNDMLTPFHYFGIADLEIDENNVEDVSLFRQLTSKERVRHITEKIEEYSVRKESRKGLIFCSRNDEAKTLSAEFNKLGYKTRAISGETSNAERNQAILDLEKGNLQYIFSVDIFNEGIDIPSLNQIIMLRKTESAIIFVQQLGRGLRKADDKEYTLVLDFIGNYQQNFLIPVALSGDRTYNKDNLRKVVKEGSSSIPGSSTVTFDEIAERRIFRAIEVSSFSNAQLIRREYEDLKRQLGRIPTLLDFDEQGAIDPLLIISKYKSYTDFLQRYDADCRSKCNEVQLSFLRFVSKRFAPGKRELELKIINDLAIHNLAFSDFSNRFERTKDELDSAVNALSGHYFRNSPQIMGDDKLLSAEFRESLDDVYFCQYLKDIIAFGLARNKRQYSKRYKDTDFVLYEKYTSSEVCYLCKWAKEPNYQNVGGYFFDEKTNTFPVFINYEKDPSISVTTQYEDRFISDRKIVAISKSKRNLNSPEIRMLKDADSNGMRCFLFLRKNKEDRDANKEYYFLGEMHPTGMFKQILMVDNKTSAVEIEYELENPVRADLYDYFLSNFGD